MTSISKHIYIDKLDDIANKYNNTYHSTVKMKLIDIESITYIDFNKENNKEDSEIRAGDYVRISRCKNTF